MSTAKNDTDANLEVSCDYVCLPIGYPSLDAVTDLVEKSVTANADSAKSSDVADKRQPQELLFASLHGSGSVFIFPSPTSPRGASDTGSGSQPNIPPGGLCVRVACIEEIQVQLNGDAALTKLLASVPLPGLVGPLLRKPFFGRKWDSPLQSDHWLASDGATVVSLRISGASAATVARTRLRFDDLRLASPGLLPSRRILHDLLEEIAREDSEAAEARERADR